MNHGCPKGKLYFLERPEEQPLGPPFEDEGYTRNVDINIHIDYWEYITKGNTYYKEQDRLKKLVSGCELAIFNYPTTNYPYHANFCGVTGTMTNILTGGFFHLYLHVLKKGTEVNICADLLTLFDHLMKNFS